ncbi:MAG: chemotaxis protein CheW [Geobacter sp.]|nr:chemotaxis protein CheW [Geobacter sp.]
MTGVPGRLVLFRLAGRRCAFDLAEVAEVTELPAVYPVPLAPPSFKGVMNCHGRLVSLLDLGGYLGLESSREGGKVLVLDRRIADLALWVDEVERIIPVAEVLSEREGEEVHIKQLLTIHDGEVPLLSALDLVEKLDAELQVIIHSPNGDRGDSRRREAT